MPECMVCIEVSSQYCVVCVQYVRHTVLGSLFFCCTCGSKLLRDGERPMPKIW